MGNWFKKSNVTIERAALLDSLGSVESATDTSHREEPLASFPYSSGPVNLLRMIVDHAPLRLESIDQAIESHERQIEQLRTESNTLRAVLTAVETTTNSQRKHHG